MENQIESSLPDDYKVETQPEVSLHSDFIKIEVLKNDPENPITSKKKKQYIFKSCIISISKLTLFKRTIIYIILGSIVILIPGLISLFLFVGIFTFNM